MKKYPQVAFGPKAQSQEQEKKLRGYHPNYIIYDEYTRMFQRDPKIVTFEIAFGKSSAPITPGHWHRASEAEQFNLMATCERLAKTGKPKHAAWRALWARYLTARLLA